MRYWDNPDVEIKELKGKVFTDIVINENKDEIRFYGDDGSEYLMFHPQDCCESVIIEDIVGDLDDLKNSPILKAEEVCNSGRGSTEWDVNDNVISKVSSKVEYWPRGLKKPEYADESYTWTFYKLATIRGSVTIRWYGSSNGYYSENVKIKRLNYKEGDDE